MNIVSTTQELIARLLPQALSNIPFHQNTPSINRLVAGEFPLHLAVHEVSPVTEPPAEYTQPHVHYDQDELNIILSNDLLVYEIRLGDAAYCVSNNASIWVPRGMVHAANVLKGSGYFITIKL